MSNADGVRTLADSTRSSLTDTERGVHETKDHLAAIRGLLDDPGLAPNTVETATPILQSLEKIAARLNPDSFRQYLDDLPSVWSSELGMNTAPVTGEIVWIDDFSTLLRFLNHKVWTDLITPYASVIGIRIVAGEDTIHSAINDEEL